MASLANRLQRLAARCSAPPGSLCHWTPRHPTLVRSTTAQPQAQTRGAATAAAAAAAAPPPRRLRPATRQHLLHALQQPADRLAPAPPTDKLLQTLERALAVLPAATTSSTSTTTTAAAAALPAGLTEALEASFSSRRHHLALAAAVLAACPEPQPPALYAQAVRVLCSNGDDAAVVAVHAAAMRCHAKLRMPVPRLLDVLQAAIRLGQHIKALDLLQDVRDRHGTVPPVLYEQLLALVLAQTVPVGAPYSREARNVLAAMVEAKAGPTPQTFVYLLDHAPALEAVKIIHREIMNSGLASLPVCDAFIRAFLRVTAALPAADAQADLIFLVQCVRKLLSGAPPPSSPSPSSPTPLLLSGPALLERICEHGDVALAALTYQLLRPVGARPPAALLHRMLALVAGIPGNPGKPGNQPLGGSASRMGAGTMRLARPLVQRLWTDLELELHSSGQSLAAEHYQSYACALAVLGEPGPLTALLQQMTSSPEAASVLAASPSLQQTLQDSCHHLGDADAALAAARAVLAVGGAIDCRALLGAVSNVPQHYPQLSALADVCRPHCSPAELLEHLGYACQRMAVRTAVATAADAVAVPIPFLPPPPTNSTPTGSLHPARRPLPVLVLSLWHPATPSSPHCFRLTLGRDQQLQTTSGAAFASLNAFAAQFAAHPDPHAACAELGCLQHDPQPYNNFFHAE